MPLVSRACALARFSGRGTHRRSALRYPARQARNPGGGGNRVILNIPPLAVFGENIDKYDQIKRSFSAPTDINKRILDFISA